MNRNQLLVASLLSLAACGISPNDRPTVVLSVDKLSTLTIQLQRGDDHTFGTTHARANGLDAGYPTLVKGSEGITFSQAASPATATWQMDMNQLGESVHVVVSEDDDDFTVDVPTLGSPRAPELLTSVTAPIVPGDYIDVTDGVATDRVVGMFALADKTGQDCTVQWGVRLTPGMASMKLGAPEDLQYDWWCGNYPAAGTLMTGTLTVDVEATAQTTCSGDDLTCPPARLSDQQLVVPVQVQF